MRKWPGKPLSGAEVLSPRSVVTEQVRHVGASVINPLTATPICTIHMPTGRVRGY